MKEKLQAVAMESWTRKTRDYDKKLSVRVDSQIVEQFKTYGRRKLATFKAVYLSFHLFDAL